MALFRTHLVYPIILTGLVIAAIFTPLSHATHSLFLKKSVINAFSKAQFSEFQAYIDQQLDTIDDKQIASWRSDDQKIFAQFKVVFSYRTNNLPCRRLRIILATKDKRNPFQFEVCKTQAGWQIQDTAARHFKDQDWVLFTDAADAALNHQEIHIPYSWFNRDTGNSGTVIVTKNYADSPKCRQLAATIIADNGAISNAHLNLCITQDKKWENDAAISFDLNR